MQNQLCSIKTVLGLNSNYTSALMILQSSLACHRGANLLTLLIPQIAASTGLRPSCRAYTYMFSTASTILAKGKLLLLTLLRSISDSVLHAHIKTFCCLYCVYDG
jgi:hypothetical protein